MWATARRPGVASWTGAATTSRWSPGTPQGPAGQRTRRSRSAWPATPTAWPASPSGSAWGGRTWPGCRSAAPSPWPPPPAPHRPQDAGPGVRLRRMGRVPARRGHRAAPAPGDGPGRPGTGRVRGHAPADDVLGGHAARVGRRRRRQHARVPPGRLPGHGPRLGRGPARRPAPRRSPHPPGLRRPGRPRPLPVAQDLHRSIPGSTLVVLPDAGHVCNIEASEAFNQTVRSFLHDHGGPWPGR